LPKHLDAAHQSGARRTAAVENKFGATEVNERTDSVTVINELMAAAVDDGVAGHPAEENILDSEIVDDGIDGPAGRAESPGHEQIGNEGARASARNYGTTGGAAGKNMF
jgi:hypothetical protein